MVSAIAPWRTEVGDDRIARLMTETLEEGLSRLRGQPVRIREMRREFLESSSSFRTERLHLSLDGGGPLRVFFKDLDPEHQLDKARAVRELDLGPSRRSCRCTRRSCPRSASEPSTSTP